MDGADNTTASSDAALRRSASTTSTKVADNAALSRGGTLKKKHSLRKRDSLRRSSSKRSLRAGSIKGVANDEDDFDSVFHTPIPTAGNPTEVLADRFHAWRKLLKDLITYFREIQSSYEQRSRSLLKVSNVLNNTNAPPMFLAEGGLDDATRSLRAFHKLSVAEANKSKDIENDVITQLSGLRSDLNQKIKEIKSLSGDFKNSVDREKDGTRKAVTALQDAIAVAESDPSAANGKNDPFIVRLSVERQVEKQIEEENYLHRAYLNLEGSGRELESIVVGEIQKAYNAYASILKRESDSALRVVDELRTGPIAMPKDHEWDEFVQNEGQFVNPSTPLRRLDEIHFPGKFNPVAAEIRAGMLERKSKYLKSYTPGWYVLSATHLHEFKSADHIHTQQPVMSLCLLDQKLGSRSQRDASSHKFSLKGRQTGGMHRGHSWVFRAESWDTMTAWYEDIQNLTEKSGAEKTAFVRKHARSVSGGSRSAPSVSSDGMEDDEADSKAFAAGYRQPSEVTEATPKRPEPGGRFPSDINVSRANNSQAPPSPSSASSIGKKGAVEDPSATKDSTEAPAATVAKSASPAAPNEPATAELPGASAVVAPIVARPQTPDAKDSTQQDEPITSHQTETLQPGLGVGVGQSTEQAPSPSGDEVVAAAGGQTPGHDEASRLRATGHVFPSVLRHDTAMTVSELHVPGEWTSSQPNAGQR